VIRAQQTLHRRVWLALALALPLVLACALLKRARHARLLALTSALRAAP
jgi:hypothetical protein